MNYLWVIMLLLGFFFSVITGSLQGFTDGLLQSSTRAVNFTIGLIGILCLWCGIMNIAENSGLIERISRIAMPLMNKLFPSVKSDATLAMMLMSFSANIFGAGNSATVFSLKAMQMMDEENHYKPVASNAMCMFMALSMSMLQLIPITIIKIRQDLGSESPGSIILPAILSGLVSMLVSASICAYYQSKESGE